ncbi:hypothetical protein [Kitasatospora sp. NPDC058218]|uniref:protein kinase domain-containing protein n=1 Tax=Kitasatospora sp. NPDC058218 TaxID=3346385 RepID=UPI0036DBB2E0
MADQPAEPSPPTRRQAPGSAPDPARGSGGQGAGRPPVPRGERRAGADRGAGPAGDESPRTRLQRGGAGAGANGGGQPGGDRADPARSRGGQATGGQAPGDRASGGPAGGDAGRGAGASPPTRLQGGRRGAGTPEERAGQTPGDARRAPADSTATEAKRGKAQQADRTDAANASPPTRRQGERPGRPGPAAVPSPRTRLQSSRTDPPPDARTRRQPPAPAPSSAPAGGGAGTGGTAAEATGGFPPALLDRFLPYGVAGSGSEGTVWHAARTDGGGDAAVKVGNPGVRADTELLEHLSDPAFHRHVPEVLGHGRVEHAGVLLDWMAMEYLPVTLADHVASLRTRGRLGRPGETERIVRELVALLDFWQSEVRRNPVDFKPANILVRRAGRGRSAAAEFVVADFGGVAKLTASRRFSPDMQVTVAYMAPEQLAGQNHRAGPWWALGTILFELFTGRTRFHREDGGLISDEALQQRLVIDAEVDLAPVTDERRRLLLQGLFTKDPADRWTAVQVREWLGGGSPEVVRSRVADPVAAPAGPAHEPIVFGAQEFHDPVMLAVALLARSVEAAAWLENGGARRLRDWLRDEVKDNPLEPERLAAVERARPADRTKAAALAVLAVGAVFAPEAVPAYRGRPIDTAGLARLADDGAGADFVRELVAAGAPALAARFHCGHPDCAQGNCARLRALTELDTVLNAVDREARALGGGSGDSRLSAEERTTARRLALLLTVQPRQRRTLVGRFSPLPPALGGLPAGVHTASAAATDAAAAVRGRARRTARSGFRRNWSALRRRALAADPGTTDGRAVLVAAAVLHVRSLRAAGTDKGRRGGAQKVRTRTRWTAARRALPRRALAAVLLTVALAPVLWSGAVWRLAVDAGAGAAVLPNGVFGGPLKTAGELAARQTVGQLGAMLAVAAAVAGFPARIGRRVLALVVAAVFAIGYLRLGPPMTVLRPPQEVVDRVVLFEGGLGSWAGIASVAAVLMALVLNNRADTWLLTPAREAEEQAAGDRRRLADRRQRRGNGAPQRWRTGRDGGRDRLLFVLGATLALTALLWAAVEIRLAVTEQHPTPESWGTGRSGAAYQAGFLLLLAVLSGLAATAAPRAARRLFGLWALGTVVLGAWPPPLGPLEALRIPVLEGWFGSLAQLWGHAAFWAAVLVALPAAGYLGLWAVRRSAG